MMNLVKERKIIKRDSSIVRILSERNVKLNCSAYVDDISDKITKKGIKTNLLLVDIEFSFNGVDYYIDHCWLQQCDYPSSMLGKAEIGELYYMEFSFYKYRDAIDRGMHGMSIDLMEIY